VEIIESVAAHETAHTVNQRRLREVEKSIRDLKLPRSELEKRLARFIYAAERAMDDRIIQ
jgi:hypothetical protein